MPKVKKKSPKRKKGKKKNKRTPLGILLFVGLVAFGLVFWLSSQPEMDESSEVTAQTAESSQTPKPRIKAKRQAPADIKPQEEESLPVKIVKDADSELDLAIGAAIGKLGIPDNAFRRRKRGDQINYSVAIDRSVMDLTFANMIFKGEVEQRNGKLESGSERSGRQYLVFSMSDSPITYNLELYYDSKIYSSRVQKKLISIVVDDFGDISGDLLKGFLEVDTEVCFAIFPDAPHSQDTMRRAAAQGRETLIHIPMEPLNYPAVNPGRNAIFVTMSETEIERRMSKFISDMNLCSGANNHMGSLATTDESIMQPVMNSLKKSGLYFLDSRTSNISVAYNVAQKTHIPAFRNDVFLDSPNLSNDTFEKKMAQINDLSSRNAHVIAITHCFTKDHLDYLKRFVQRLKASGYTIVPVSRLGQQSVPEIL